MRGLKHFYLIFLISHLNAQMADVNWYVGSGVGIEFKNCMPLVNTTYNNDGFSWEGNTTISDNDGNLLFYSNGYNIYNKNHLIMSGGSAAGISNSITQNIIIPKPGNDNIYYLITTDVQAGISYSSNHPNATGINFAVIDMNLQNGLGEVTSSFNVLKSGPNCEMLCLIPHSNDIDYWLIGHEYGNNNFFLFQITNTGINSVPLIQSVGPIINTAQSGIPGNSNLDAIGELKASPDASLLAFTTYFNGTTCIFNFDRNTGMISNPNQINLNGLGGYGVSFSPDNTKLYLSTFESSILYTNLPSDHGKLLQFDLTNFSASAIESTKYIINDCSNCVFADLKLGPDGKIYVAHYGQSGNSSGDYYVGVIDNPNDISSSINYNHNGVYLGGKQGSWSLNNYIERNDFCNTIGLIENKPFDMKRIIKILDTYGNETAEKTNALLIYLFDDGTTDKVFRIE